MKFGKYDIPEDAFERNKKGLKKLLDIRSYETVRMRCEEKMTFAEIAKAYGVSETRVMQIVAKSSFLAERNGYIVN